MTINYQDKAKIKVDEFLATVDERLRKIRSVDGQEVMQNLQEHIEHELELLERPVSEADVDEVLARLGTPEEIVGDQDMSPWQTFILRLRRGPEDWRLAYLSLGLLLLGPIGLIFSFLLSRAAVSLSDELDPPAKKWLVYPSLIIVYATILLPLLFWPAFVGGGGAKIYQPVTKYRMIHHVGSQPTICKKTLYREPLFDSDGLGTYTLCFTCGVLGLALWWSLIWSVLRKRPQWIRTLFKPFADSWTGRGFGQLTLAIWGLAVLLGCFTYELFILQDSCWPPR